MADVLGTSPDINGNFTFSRFNPVVGLAYKILPEMTFYTGYSEANRAPTPLELSCSNPLALSPGRILGIRSAARNSIGQLMPG